MESLSDWVEEFIATVGDSFLALPYLLIGITFFIGALTSNVGLLYLFIGQLFIVPLICFLANEPGPPLWPFNRPNVPKILKWILSYFTIFTINAVGTGYGTFGLYGGGMATAQQAGAFILPIWTLLVQYYDVAYNPSKDYNGNITVMDTVNPYNLLAFFFGWKEPPLKRECSLIPSSPSPQRASPSTWICHIAFFTGFVIANAIAIFNEPIPNLRMTTDPKINQTRETALTERVENRKWISSAIICMAIFVFVLLVFARRYMTVCEDSLWLSLYPMIFILITGGAWFSFLQKTCGIRPADVLGIVQGMISPELIDNPIICTGS